MIKDFIKQWNSLLSIMANISGMEKSISTGELSTLLTQYQGAVIALGNDLEKDLEDDMVRRIAPDMVCDSDEYFDELKKNKETLIHYIEEYCELIYEYSQNPGSSFETKVHMLEKEGAISLMLRFGFFYSMQQIHDQVKDVNFKQVVVRLNMLGELNGDYYPVHMLWQHSSRKYLPRFSVPDTAIVMQGPILYDGDFTLETLLRYRYIYPDTTIILSTWMGEATAEFKRCAAGINVEVVECEKPDDCGPYNLNLQLTNTLAGIQRTLENDDIRYAMKCRTDQRFFLPDFLMYLKNTLKQYKPAADSPLSSRIVFLGGKSSMCTFPFRIADFFAFGDKRDIEKLYSASPFGDIIFGTYTRHYEEQAQRVLERVRHENGSVWRSLDKDERMKISKEITTRDPESYLIQTFYEDHILKRKLEDDEDKLAHYWNFLRDHTVIVDPDMLIFYWRKYAVSYLWYDECAADGGLTHSVWLDMYLNMD